jgi:hypothetical protein
VQLQERKAHDRGAVTGAITASSGIDQRRGSVAHGNEPMVPKEVNQDLKAQGA